MCDKSRRAGARSRTIEFHTAPSNGDRMTSGHKVRHTEIGEERERGRKQRVLSTRDSMRGIGPQSGRDGQFGACPASRNTQRGVRACPARNVRPACPPAGHVGTWPCAAGGDVSSPRVAVRPAPPRSSPSTRGARESRRHRSTTAPASAPTGRAYPSRLAAPRSSACPRA